MDKFNLMQIKQSLYSVQWHEYFEKANKENYEILDKLCEYIKEYLNKNPRSETVNDALLLLANNLSCGKDFERYEYNFVDVLFGEGLLAKEQYDLFCNNTNRRQG